MTRPIRIEQAGGWYHLTARGNERKAIYRDDRDRQLLKLGSTVVEVGSRLFIMQLPDRSVKPCCNFSIVMCFFGKAANGRARAHGLDLDPSAQLHQAEAA